MQEGKWLAYVLSLSDQTWRLVAKLSSSKFWICFKSLIQLYKIVHHSWVTAMEWGCNECWLFYLYIRLWWLFLQKMPIPIDFFSLDFSKTQSSRVESTEKSKMMTFIWLVGSFMDCNELFLDYQRTHWKWISLLKLWYCLKIDLSVQFLKFLYTNHVYIYIFVVLWCKLSKLFNKGKLFWWMFLIFLGKTQVCKLLVESGK